MGRPRERDVRDRGREAHAARGQGVEGGRGRTGVAVAAEVIGAQRVDRDEEDVRPCGRGARRSLPPAAGDEEEGKECRE